MNNISEVGQKHIDVIDARLRENATLLEPLYDQIDALSDEASTLLQRKTTLRSFELAAQGHDLFGRSECALDPFTVTVRTLGQQRRLTLRSCSKAFYLSRVVPQIVKALAEIGLDMHADEQNIATLSSERWEQEVFERFGIENETS